MKKILLIAGLVVAVVVAVAVTLRYTTKSHSPSSVTSFEDGNLKISVNYNRPYKKGRTIFGGLVPYGKTWRTGANEPTVFETSRPLRIGEKTLEAGSYSLWTVPNEASWQVIFNKSIPAWGINVLNHGDAARDPQTDVLAIDVPVMTMQKEFEQFTISIEKADDTLELVLMWDKTMVAVPLSVNE
jgi:hypothetical protein